MELAKMLESFGKLASIVVRPLSFEETLSAFMRELIRLSSSQGGFVLLLGEGDRLEPVCIEGKVPSGKPEEISKELGRRNLPGTSLTLGEGKDRWLAIPIQAAGHLFGYAVIASRSEPLPNEFIRALGPQLALVLEKAKLDDNVGLLCSIIRSGKDAFDMGTLFSDIYDQVSRLLGASAFYIALYDKSRDLLKAEFIREGEKTGQGKSVPLGEAGLPGWVFRHRQAIFIEDWAVESRALPLEDPFLSEKPVSWMGAPLLIRGKGIGVIAIGQRRPRVFSERHLILLESLASQISVILENAKLYARFRKVLKGLTALQKMNTQLSIARNTSKVVNVLLENLLDITEADVAWAALEKDAISMEKLGEFFVSTSEHLKARESDRLLELLGRSLLKRAIEEKKPVVMAKAEEISKLIGEESPIRSMVAFPILKNGLPVSAFGVGFVEERVPDEEEFYLLELQADQMAVALESVRLFQERSVRLKQLGILNELSRVLGTSLEPNRLLEQAGAFVRDMYPVEAGGLFIRRDGGLELNQNWGYKGDLLFNLDEDAFKSFLAEPRAQIVDEGLELHPRLKVRSGLVVPIATKDETYGLLLLLNRLDEKPFADEDALLMDLVAANIAGALEKAYLYDQTQGRLTEMVTLYAISQQINSSLDLTTVLETIVDVIKHVMDCRGACIFLLNEETGWLEIRAASGLTSRWRKEAKLRVGEGVSGKVAATGKPIYIPDTYEDPEFIFFDRSVRSLLVVPLVVKDKVIGTLSIDDIKPNAFTPEDERFLSIVAAQAAVAIENATLYEKLKERAQILKKAYEEMSELSRLKTQFVQNISHELRTPLTFIKGYVELLLEQAMGPLSDEQKEALEVVSEKADVITRLVEDIVLLQKAEAGKLDMAPVSIYEVAKLSVQSASLVANEAGLEIHLDATPDIPLVMGDKTRLMQVFDNLLSNAIKFSPEGGIITVRLKDVGDFVQAEVQDQGIGIPEDELDKIFDRFYQVDGSTTRRFGGMGLGLAIAKSIVEAHGGRIWVESKLGEGSTFYFTVPKARPGVAELVGDVQQARREIPGPPTPKQGATV